MTAVTAIHARIEDGTAFVQFIEDDVHPSFLFVTAAPKHLRCLGIAQVAFEPFTGILRVSTRSVGSIHHVGSHAAVEHQLCHSVALFRGVLSFIAVDHVSPVIDTLIIVDGHFLHASVRLLDIHGVCTRTTLRITVVVHDLCHGGSDTSGHGSSRTAIPLPATGTGRGCLGAEVVVRFLLSPTRRDKGGNLSGILVLVGDHHLTRHAALHNAVDGLFGSSEIPFEALVLRILVERAVRIGDDSRYEVVVAHDDETALLITHDGVCTVFQQRFEVVLVCTGHPQCRRLTEHLLRCRLDGSLCPWCCRNRQYHAQYEQQAYG